MSAAPRLARETAPLSRSWDEFVRSSPGGTVFQTWEWAVARRRGGWEPHLMSIRGPDGSIRAGVILGIRKVGPWTVGYAPRGPVWSNREALVQLLTDLRGYAVDAGIVFVKLNPDLSGDDPDLTIFHEAGYRSVPSDAYLHRATYRIDLSGSEEALLSRMEGRTRRAIARSFRDGVVVDAGTDPGLLGRFGRLVRATARRRRFPAPSPEFLDDLRTGLVPRSGFGISLARLEGSDLAGAIHLSFAGRRSYMWGGSSPERRLKCANAGERLQWEAILAARRAGEHTYDFHGVPVEPTGEPTGGIHLFKRGFGGDLVKLAGDLDLPLRPVLYRAWLRLQPLYLHRKGGG